MPLAQLMETPSSLEDNNMPGPELSQSAGDALEVRRVIPHPPLAQAAEECFCRLLHAIPHLRERQLVFVRRERGEPGGDRLAVEPRILL